MEDYSLQPNTFKDVVRFISELDAGRSYASASSCSSSSSASPISSQRRRKRRGVIVVVGAGISTSCGVPDFRSPGSGLYSNQDLTDELLEMGLPQAECAFHIEVFNDQPQAFYRAARRLMPPPSSTTTTAAAGEGGQQQQRGNMSSGKYKVNANNGEGSVGKDTGGGQKNDGWIRPSLAHQFVRELDRRGLLLRCYTQNVDGLETRCGVSPQRVVHCHGSLATARCTRCNAKYQLQEYISFLRRGIVFRCTKKKGSRKGRDTRGRGHAQEEEMMHEERKEGEGAGERKEKRRSTSSSSSSSVGKKRKQASSRSLRPRKRLICYAEDGEGGGGVHVDDLPPLCCCGGVVKPDIVFFGESLPNSVSRSLTKDRADAAILLVLGSSLSVAPLSEVLTYLPPSVPQVLINRNRVKPRLSLPWRGFDAEVLGDCDVVIDALLRELGWNITDSRRRRREKNEQDEEEEKKGGKMGGGGEEAEEKEKNRRQKMRRIDEGGGGEKKEEEEGLQYRFLSPNLSLFVGAVFDLHQYSPEASARQERRDEKEQQKKKRLVEPSTRLPSPTPPTNIVCDVCRNVMARGAGWFSCNVCFAYDLCHLCHADGIGAQRHRTEVGDMGHVFTKRKT